MNIYIIIFYMVALPTVPVVGPHNNIAFISEIDCQREAKLYKEVLDYLGPDEFRIECKEYKLEVNQ